MTMERKKYFSSLLTSDNPGKSFRSIANRDFTHDFDWGI